MDGQTVRISFLLGKQLMCRKPGIRTVLPCNHPKWWQKLLGKVETCGLNYVGNFKCREQVNVEHACDAVKSAVAQLPSYRELEIKDQELYPDAIPCPCCERASPKSP